MHGSDGLDELTITGPSLVAEWTGSEVKEYSIAPQDVGLAAGPIESLRGGDAPTNAGILRSVLEGDDGGPRHVALLNAGAALVAAAAAEDLREGVELARTSIDSGAALGRLESLLGYSQALREREGGMRAKAEKVDGGIPVGARLIGMGYLDEKARQVRLRRAREAPRAESSTGCAGAPWLVKVPGRWRRHSAQAIGWPSSPNSSGVALPSVALPTASSPTMWRGCIGRMVPPVCRCLQTYPTSKARWPISGR